MSLEYVVVLEILSLEGCSDLQEANIDTPNLVKFNYEGSMEVHPLVISATECSVKIRLLRFYIDPVLSSNAISQFLSCFYHIKDITFTSPRVEVCTCFAQIYICHFY